MRASQLAFPAGDIVAHVCSAEVAGRNATGYDKAAGLLVDLRAIAWENGTAEDFVPRLRAIRKRHA